MSSGADRLAAERAQVCQWRGALAAPELSGLSTWPEAPHRSSHRSPKVKLKTIQQQFCLETP